MNFSLIFFFLFLQCTINLSVGTGSDVIVVEDEINPYSSEVSYNVVDGSNELATAEDLQRTSAEASHKVVDIVDKLGTAEGIQRTPSVETGHELVDLDDDNEQTPPDKSAETGHEPVDLNDKEHDEALLDKSHEHSHEENSSSDNIDDLPELYDEIRLPQALRPTFFQISIFPHIYGTDPKAFTYDCETIINITCKVDTNVVILHSLDNNIWSWTISDKPEHAEKGYLRYNLDKELVEIYVGFMMVAGRDYVLTLQSNSSLSTSLRGIYYSPYKAGNKTEYVITTMMEPTDARRVFPCFDEPDFKAIFTFRIKRKADISSLTNLPKRISIGPDEAGYVTDVFDQPQNVPMSTYLVAIAIGHFDCLESSVNNISFRTYSRKAAVNQTRYALEVGMKFMEFFEDYFQIPYSLPKEDMIAVPTMSFSGMEHWGLITYREDAMLYEEGVSSLEDKEWTTIIIAHEIAHQWFGNLVSPQWWDDLWLNEGFATYMMYLAVDRVMPEWNMINKLIVDFRGVQNVMTTDANILSHPVYVSVYDPVEITQIFDLISYAKGGSVIRMMNFFLGEDTFRKGLTRFLKSFSYQTATHRDLWESLSQQAREDKHTYSNVMDVMNTWILEANYPIVMVKKKDNVTLELTQSAFLQNEGQRLMRQNIIWKIPFAYTTSVDGNFDKTFEDIHWLDDKTLTVRDTSLPDTTWIIGNVLQYGFYRVNYDVAIWEAILHQLDTDHEVIHPINRAQIINDAWNIARAGMLDFEIALRTLDYLDSETDFVPWKAAIRELDTLKVALQPTSVYGPFENYMRRKLAKAYRDTAGASSHYKRVQYIMIAKEACNYGLQDCVDDAMSKFEAWMKDADIRIAADLKETVYCTGVRHGGIKAWETVLQRFKESHSTSERRFLVNSLACTETPWILYKLIELVFETNTFHKTESVVVLMNLLKTSVGRLLVWSIVDKYWEVIRGQYSQDIHLFSGILESMAKSVSTNLDNEMLNCFLEKHDESGVAKTLMGKFFVNTAGTNMDGHFEDVKEWLLRESGPIIQ